MLNAFIKFFLENKLVAFLLLLAFTAWGLVTAPFDFGIKKLPRDPVAVDAIPDIGENQQIVFTEWMGRSPQDVEDQLTYPLTTSLLGIPGVKSIRSNSMFGFSSIYVIFEDHIDFYWSRSRILEKLNALPANTLPEGVQPTLGPDATALGQIFWYTLEGRDQAGNPTGGWDLHELRSIQDFDVRYALSSAKGVSEVASIGGFVKEYQVDVDPVAMKSYNISLEEVMQAIGQSNLDIGAQTIEINLAEYFVRGLGYIESIEDIEEAVIKTVDKTPIRIMDLARVNIGPANRRGILDKSGAEVVGGVVVARYGSNPMEVIENVKAKIAEIEPGLPSKILADGSFSQLKIIPFYDRTSLIKETIGTLQEALSLEIIITVIVILLMLFNLRSSIIVSASLPVAVLMCFIAMKYFGVDANIVALSGIAIAIGTMVDMGIVLVESIVRRMKAFGDKEKLITTIYNASTEVASAVLTAVATTIISFLPVFTMEAAEGKLFRPLAFTKTFALIASIIVAITIIPALSHTLFSLKLNRKSLKYLVNGFAVLGGIFIFLYSQNSLGLLLSLIGFSGILQSYFSDEKGVNKLIPVVSNIAYAVLVTWLLAKIWMPLGVDQSNFQNFLFVSILAGALILVFLLTIRYYELILRFLLRFKIFFLVLVGLIVYQGFLLFKDTGQEFMPALDEGSFLLMPTSMPHSGTQENLKNLRLLDMAVTAIPEVETVVGKAGRVNSALDPAPLSMFENVILYKSEYKTDEEGHRIRFKIKDGKYLRDEDGKLIPDKNGQYFRQWRDQIQSPNDIWNEIVKVSQIPGLTSAPKLQPIETRLVMLQTGMRAPMGIKVQGTNIDQIEVFGLELENLLKGVEGVKSSAVFADRLVGKPYLLLDIDRQRIARYGLSIEKVQQHIQAAIGGMNMSTTLEGRERYNIRVRYPRELRDDLEAIKRIYVSTSQGEQILLGDLVDIRYEQGPQALKSEDGFLVSYVLFDKEDGYAEGKVVENARQFIESQISNGSLSVPAGVKYRFAGNYEQQQRANERLSLLIPIALLIILLILYFQFRSLLISLMVFTGVFIAFAGGFIMIGLYNTDWFLDFQFLGSNMRDVFQIQSINLSVAVWVGFLALFGIATDDGVLVATFLQQSFRKSNPQTKEEIRDAVVNGGLRRVRPAMMTTATTILALLPILSSTGRGSDIMVPMAIPSFGGMLLQIITMFTVPVLYSLWKEWDHSIKSFQFSKSTSMKILSVPVLLTIGISGISGQSLTVLKSRITEENLELKVIDYQYKAALEKAPQVSQWSDPEFAIAAFPLPVETRLGPQLMRLGVTQMLPWRSELTAKKDLELKKAATITHQAMLKQLELGYEIEKAYLSLYKLENSQQILEEKINILGSLEQLILGKVESDQANLSQVLSIQIKIEEIKQEIKILEAQKRNFSAIINQILNRDPEANIEIEDSFVFFDWNWNKTSLLNEILVEHPAISLYKQEKSISNQRAELNKLNKKPDFGVGMDYILVGQRNDGNPMNNGRDILSLRAAVKIPLNTRKYDAKDREEQFRVLGIEEQVKQWSKFIEAEIERAFSNYEVAKLKFELYNDQMELLEKKIDLLEGEYTAEEAKLEELLSAELELIQYKLKKLEAIVESHLAKASILRFIQNM